MIGIHDGVVVYALGEVVEERHLQRIAHDQIVAQRARTGLRRVDGLDRVLVAGEGRAARQVYLKTVGSHALAEGRMLPAFHAINIIGKVAHVALVESRRGSDPRECGLVALALLERDLRGSQRLIVADIGFGSSLRARSHTVLGNQNKLRLSLRQVAQRGIDLCTRRSLGRGHNAAVGLDLVGKLACQVVIAIKGLRGERERGRAGSGGSIKMDRKVMDGSRSLVFGQRRQHIERELLIRRGTHARDGSIVQVHRVERTLTVGVGGSPIEHIGLGIDDGTLGIGHSTGIRDTDSRRADTGLLARGAIDAVEVAIVGDTVAVALAGDSHRQVEIVGLCDRGAGLGVVIDHTKLPALHRLISKLTKHLARLGVGGGGISDQAPVGDIGHFSIILTRLQVEPPVPQEDDAILDHGLVEIKSAKLAVLDGGSSIEQRLVKRRVSGHVGGRGRIIGHQSHVVAQCIGVKHGMLRCLQHLTCLAGLATLGPCSYRGHATLTVVDQLAELEVLGYMDGSRTPTVALANGLRADRQSQRQGYEQQCKTMNTFPHDVLSKKYSMCPGVANDSL